MLTACTFADAFVFGGPAAVSPGKPAGFTAGGGRVLRPRASPRGSRATRQQPLKADGRPLPTAARSPRPQDSQGGSPLTRHVSILTEVQVALVSSSGRCISECVIGSCVSVR